MHPAFPELTNVEKIRLKYQTLDYIYQLQQRSYNLEPIRLVNTALNRRMIQAWARSEREKALLEQRIQALGARAYNGTAQQAGESDFVPVDKTLEEMRSSVRERRTTNLALGGALPGLLPGRQAPPPT